MSARFLFIMRGAFDPTVIDSQVVDAIAAVAPFGPRFELVAFTEGSTWFSQRAFLRERQREIAQRTGTRVKAHLALRQGRPEGNAFASAVLWGELARRPARRTVIHARGDGAAAYASRVRRLWPGVRYVYDVRGDSEAEFRLHPEIHGLTPQSRDLALSRIGAEQASAVRGASHLLCVSNVLRERLMERHRIPPDRIRVVPCVADTGKFHPDEARREEMRRALGVKERFVVVYPGRFGRWHYGPQMVEVVRGLAARHPDLYFLVLTPDVEEAQRLVGAALPPGSFEIRTARHAEVPDYLRASDLGLLLRERHPLNEAACPTKFAEYVTSGLPVLISAGIGDCSPFVAAHGAGVVLDDDDPARASEALSRLRSEPDAPRRARIARLSDRFSRTRVAQEMAELYLRLAAS